MRILALQEAKDFIKNKSVEIQKHLTKEHHKLIDRFIAFKARTQNRLDEVDRLELTVQELTMKEALDMSLEMSEPGDTLVFSPGYSSFDQFDNFEHRGNLFKEMVNAL